MIKPTIGRVVWYWPTGDTSNQPHAAIIARVWSDEMVNLAAFDGSGVSYSRTSVPLYQGEGPRPTGMHCEWMPYQKGQAAKAEQLEQQLSQGFTREPIDNGDRHQAKTE
jgi:hypothetical protein